MVNVGDKVFHNKELMTVKYDDVLVDRNGDYHKMTTDDYNFGKNIRGRYFHTGLETFVEITDEPRFDGEDWVASGIFESTGREHTSLMLVYLRRPDFHDGDMMLVDFHGRELIAKVKGDTADSIFVTFVEHEKYGDGYVPIDYSDVVRKLPVGTPLDNEPRIKPGTWVEADDLMLTVVLDDQTDLLPILLSDGSWHSIESLKLVNNSINIGDKLKFGNWTIEAIDDVASDDADYGGLLRISHVNKGVYMDLHKECSGWVDDKNKEFVFSNFFTDGIV